MTGEKKGFQERHSKIRKNLKAVLGSDHPVHDWMDAAEEAMTKRKLDEMCSRQEDK